jgi:two-component system phosphate regulon sensor histidine kinase PhoR
LMWIGKDPGLRRAVVGSGRLIQDPAGKAPCAALAFHDVTDLMRALRIKEDFVALVSHELRTPLTSIMGYLEMSSEFDDDLPSEVVHYLVVANRNAERLLSLVSDLLTASGSHGGSVMRLFPQEVDLSGLVQEALDDVTQRVEIADVDVVTHLEPLVHVLADPNRVTQVVENLLSNAVKYTPPGGRITVSLTSSSNGVRLEVRDTGIGISQSDQQGLFTEFFRARSATDREIAGMGLGLVIAKAIVEAHGGEIALASDEGLGTTVEVTLPYGPDLARVLVGQLPSLDV